MRKAILLSKRTSSLPQGLHAPQGSHDLRPTRTAKKDKGSTSKAEDNPIVECTKCGALMWTSESTGKDFKTGELTFTICCNHGQIKLPPINQPPPMLEELLQQRWFRDTIRVYNSVLAFTSIGMKMDYTVVNAPGPYTIRIQVRNRLNAMGQTSTEGNLDETTLARLIEMLDENNCLAKLFRRARDYYEDSGQEFNIRLLSDKGKGKEYDLPSTSEVAGLIVGDMSSTIGVRDIVVQFQSDTLQQIRDDHPLYMSLQYPLLFPHGGRLLHQYVVDVYTAIEEDRLRWARNNQDVLRAELYSNVLDAVSKGDTDAKVIGQRFILPPSFTGGPRYLVEKYHDAMAICREYGNPDLFITMTANPNWREIKEHLEIYGGDSPNDRPDIECRPYTAALHRIEFQKRGLPHAHILLWFGNSSRTPSSEEVDEIISAELPNKEEDPEAYNLVTKHMIHGPCGVINPKSPCMENNVCTKKYPRPYNDSTSIDKSGYVLYRRRRNENESVVKSGATLNNTFVVPHNVNLLKKYEAHINVEWCNRTSAVKYLFKYITKEYFVWNNNSKVWSERKKGKTIGRIVAVHPSAGDRYYLRILINKIKGPRSYDELKTFNDVKYPDFKSVCHARGYLDDDVEWLESMSEGARTATPYQLRDMFVTFLTTCFVASPKGLWEHSWKSMSEDILHKRQRILGHTNLELDDETLEQYTLIEVEKLMRMQDRSLNDIKEMPKIKPVLLKELGNRGTGKTFLYQTIISRLRFEETNRSPGCFFKNSRIATTKRKNSSFTL
ncbi:unnamed protein product [Brassica napus]|uniref:(rape) hypothetical protein n=1 Tax=Brassica napus TaxID=3708 RepID=A0A816SGB5_BRANA|nr:unnamed protein product [Brassica napus]